MRIIISPAKKMKESSDWMAWNDLPIHLDDTKKIYDVLRKMDGSALQTLWKCNDTIAVQNVERLRFMDLETQLTPALLAYEGIQYQYMAPQVFTQEAWLFAQEHLRILSGFYGVLRPLDGVTPYRLEMQAKLSVEGSKDLYTFWGERLAKTLERETDCILNLASKEYSLGVSRHLSPKTRFITCVFGEEKEGKLIEKGTMCKMARGEMVRFLAEHRIEQPDGAKEFRRLGYEFDSDRSNETTYVFVKR